jgi:uncharacterized membrane protein YjjB (DUF3815 family)
MTFFTTQFFIALAASFIASGSFAIIFRTNKRHLLKLCIAGALTYFIYYTMQYFSGSVFLAAFISTAFTTLYGEIFARISKAPAIIFIIAGIIPTVPGGDSYYAVKHLITGNLELATQKLIDTGAIAIGIASGIVCVSIIFGIFNDRFGVLKKKEMKDPKR